MHRAQLPRPRGGDGRRDPRRADRLHEGPQHGRRPLRRGPDPQRQREDRLGGRAGRRHRPDRPLRGDRRGGPRGGRRLRDLQRRLRARVPARTRRPVGQGQVLRDLQPARPLAGHRRRDRRPAGPGAAAVGGRRAVPGRRHQEHDLPGRRDRPLPQPVHVLEPGDVINTGTPAGVALGLPGTPYLRAGQVMELEIDGLGRQRQTVGQA